MFIAIYFVLLEVRSALFFLDAELDRLGKCAVAGIKIFSDVCKSVLTRLAPIGDR